MTKITAHSEYGKLRSLLLKRPRDAFFSAQAVLSQWEDLHYLAPPDLERSAADFDRFEGIIARTGTDIHYLPHAADVTMDSIYCRDASIATDFGMIICRMGKPARAHEPAREKRYFESAGMAILGEIAAPGTLEGGDAAWLDERTLAVGHTYRSNYAGIAQLKGMLEPRGVQVVVVELPHYKGPDDVFHLMSILSPVDRNKAVVYSPLMPICFRDELIRRGFQLIEVPDGEFGSMGCNVLAVAPGDCVMVEGNPLTRRRLEQAGCRVTEYDGAEISAKGCGGPTCLTRPIRREG